LFILVFAAGCTLDPEGASFDDNVRPWYSSNLIRVPLWVHGGIRYMDYLHEYNPGDGWVAGEEGTILISDRGDVLLEFAVDDADADHRLRLEALGRVAVGQPLEPVAAVERYFRIDNSTPLLNAVSLTLTPAPGGGYDPGTDLNVTVDHPEFAAPSGSPIRIYVTGEDRPPSQDDEVLWNPGVITVWRGGSGISYQEIRLMAVDEAGNRSAVHTVVYEGP
jgi:hypothetical protein